MPELPPPPRGVNAHYAIAAVAITVLINRRKDIKLIPSLLQRNGGKTRKVCFQYDATRSSRAHRWDSLVLASNWTVVVPAIRSSVRVW